MDVIRNLGTFFGEEEMKTVRFVSCMVAILGFCAVAGAARIPVAGVTEASGVAPPWTQPWENLINDSGMSGDTQTLADTASNYDWPNEMSVNAQTNNYPSIDLRFDLGQDYQLDEIWIWNFNMDPARWADGCTLGMKNFQIYYWADGGAETPLAWIDSLPMADGTATNAVDRIVDAQGVTARYVRFVPAWHPDLNWTGGVYNSVGLGEVRFYEVPEPATLTLLGLAGLLGLRRRR